MDKNEDRFDLGAIEPIGQPDYPRDDDDDDRICRRCPIVPADETDGARICGAAAANAGKRRVSLPDKLDAISDDLDRLAVRGRTCFERQATWELAADTHETAEEIRVRRHRCASRAATEAASKRQFEHHTLDFGMPD